MQNKRNVLKIILKQQLLPLYYLNSAKESLNILRALYKGGARIVEYTNRGEPALDNFKYLLRVKETEMPDLQLGIGTIKTKEDAKAFIESGANFIVSPIVNIEVAQFANETGTLWIPGCMTPTEIDLAQRYGALLVKVFPANVLTSGFISSIIELFPGLLFMATGGVELDDESMLNWFKSGTSVLGAGSKLISKEILINKQYELLSINTAKLLRSIRSLPELIASHKGIKKVQII
ncbi:MAG: bifunctional 4-hydroxy-2-oxoglutarate aldolase/2-dehydro-3-deoxy-phosphogluconate aldolase [Mucilaginibacter sp.]|nr:bifunctional 4-hydroxy-2-oxoglutarate aldolase/2-dehydro-3-deoxy-phosphogluconate aldolase [Mucilaginibacter sp.]